MITEVILPKLGQTMEEGAIVDWAKEEGDPVARGDVLFTVESDKAVLEVEAPARGYLRTALRRAAGGPHLCLASGAQNGPREGCRSGGRDRQRPQRPHRGAGCPGLRLSG